MSTATWRGSRPTGSPPRTSPPSPSSARCACGTASTPTAARRAPGSARSRGPVALDHFRSERRRTRREELAAPPEAIDFRFAEGLSPDLESALARLTAGEREVVALRVLLDLDAGAAARVLGISPTNCTTRLNRALKKLEEALHVAA